MDLADLGTYRAVQLQKEKLGFWTYLKTLKTHFSFNYDEGVRMAKFLTLDDVEVKDKVVLVRVDFNSPIDPETK